MIEIWSKMFTDVLVKYLLFLSEFNETWIFLKDFRRILKYQILWKSVQWERSWSVRTKGRTDRHDEVISWFSQFCQIYCISTAKMVARTSLSITLYVYCCLVLLMNLVSVSVLRDESRLNLVCYGGVPDLSLLLQCDVALLGIWFWAREICGHAPEYETFSLPRKVENQAASDTASYPRFTDTLSNILWILKIYV